MFISTESGLEFHVMIAKCNITLYVQRDFDIELRFCTASQVVLVW